MDLHLCYRFAGVEYQLEIPEEHVYTEERYLAPFRVDTVSEPHVFRFQYVDVLDSPAGDFISTEPGFCVFSDGDSSVRYIGSVQDSWQNAYMRVTHRGRTHEVQILNSRMNANLNVHTVLNTLALEHLVTDVHGFVFHSAFIEWEGKAILFTAPSGTGKSTQADLWHAHRGTEIINGDRSVIRISNGTVCAEGIPFAGSSQYCKNKSLPLAAIVYLEQAPVTGIRKMRGYEAFRRIWEGVSVNTWDKKDMTLVLETVSRTATAIPVFHLACTPDESAVIALENALKSR